LSSAINFLKIGSIDCEPCEMVTVAENLSSENVKIDTFPSTLKERVFGKSDGDDFGGETQPVKRERITGKCR
jgi:hypothetical protein